MTLTISEINRLHDQAMATYSDYLVTHDRNLLIIAGQLEYAVAEAVLAMDAPEPSRCLMLKSAALFAAELCFLRDAERYLCAALAGEPPAELIDELRRDLINILKQAGSVTFLREVDGRRLPEEPG